MSYMLCPTCGEANGVVNTTIFQCRCARERNAAQKQCEILDEAQRKFAPICNYFFGGFDGGNRCQKAKGHEGAHEWRAALRQTSTAPLCRYRDSSGKECGTPIIADANSPSGYAHATGQGWLHWASPKVYGPQDSEAAFGQTSTAQGGGK